MVETSSYGARSLVTPATCTLSPPGRRDTVPPRVSRSLVIVRTSARSGALPSVTGAAVRSAAAIAGRVAARGFENERRARAERPARGCDDAPDDRQPVTAAVQRHARLVNADLRLQAGDDGARQVRRVAHDQVGPSRAQRVGEVTDDDRDSTAEIEPPRVVSRDGRRGPRHVDRNHVDVASLRGERTRDRARARAQVEGAQSDAVLRGRQEPEGPFDQRLGLGPRDEDVRRYVDPQPPERLPAEDLLQGLTARAPPDSRRVARGDR